MRKFVSIFLFFATVELLAQGSAGDRASLESRFIVDLPTAGVVSKSQHVTDFFLFSDGGMMAEWSASPITNVNFGLSFGGTGIIGNDNISWQKVPGVHFRARIVDEALAFPAILFGGSTQGRGIYSRTIERFQTDSPGLYVAASKNFKMLGTFALHGGVNYSFDPQVSDRSLNAYIGLEKSLGGTVSLMAEYNATLSKNSPVFFNEKGLLNFALRWSVGKGFTMEMQGHDLLTHYANAKYITRTIGLEYVTPF